MLSGAESQLNQLTPGIASTSVVTLRQLRYTQPFILNWWINRVLAEVRAGVLPLLGGN